MSTKVLLTGASGFVGNQILRKLLEFDCKISVVLRSSMSSSLRANKEDITFVYTENFFKENIDWFKSILKDIDIVIHAAWFAKPEEYLESNLNLECTEGSLEFARIAKESQVKRFVGIGTCLEYDLTNGKISVDTPLKPISLYARAKAKVFTELSENFSQGDTQFVWCRLFSLYGENEHRDRFVPSVREGLRNRRKVEILNGSHIRDYLDVEIAGAQIAEVAMSQFTGAVNICSGIPISLKDLALNLSQTYGSPELLVFDDSTSLPAGYPYIVGIPNWKLSE